MNISEGQKSLTSLLDNSICYSIFLKSRYNNNTIAGHVLEGRDPRGLSNEQITYLNAVHQSVVCCCPILRERVYWTL